MDALRTCVTFMLLVTVSCEDVVFTVPLTCYLLDGVLFIYCIIATALYFGAKVRSSSAGMSENNGGVYQELERPASADPYSLLEPPKRKKKADKKKKSQTTQPENDSDPLQSVNRRALNPQMSHQ